MTPDRFGFHPNPAVFLLNPHSATSARRRSRSDPAYPRYCRQARRRASRRRCSRRSSSQQSVRQPTMRRRWSPERARTRHTPRPKCSTVMARRRCPISIRSRRSPTNGCSAVRSPTRRLGRSSSRDARRRSCRRCRRHLRARSRRSRRIVLPRASRSAMRWPAPWFPNCRCWPTSTIFPRRSEIAAARSPSSRRIPRRVASRRKRIPR